MAKSTCTLFPGELELKKQKQKQRTLEDTMNKEVEKRREQRAFVSEVGLEVASDPSGSLQGNWNEDLQGLTGKADDRRLLPPCYFRRCERLPVSATVPPCS